MKRLFMTLFGMMIIVIMLKMLGFGFAEEPTSNQERIDKATDPSALRVVFEHDEVMGVGVPCVGWWQWPVEKVGGDDLLFQIMSVGEHQFESHAFKTGDSRRGLVFTARDAGGGIAFAIQRDAGRFDFNGRIEHGYAKGDVIFVGDQAFIKEAGLLGGKLENWQLVKSVVYDVRLGDVQKLRGMNITDLDFEGVIKIVAARVDLEKVSALMGEGERTVESVLDFHRKHGHDNAVKERAVEQKSEEGRGRHDENGSVGVKKENVDQPREVWDISANDLTKLQMAGVSLEEARELCEAGCTYSVNEMISLQMGGVSLKTAKEIFESGCRFDSDELLMLQRGGVSRSFIIEMKEAGYVYSAKELYRLRMAGVTSSYAKALYESVGKHYAADELMRLYRQGVNP